MAETTRRTNDRPLVYLASGSPQRRAILEELGIPYQLLPVDVAEITAATPRETVEENAVRKLLAGLRIADVGATHASPVLVIAADTVLEVQGRLLGKPADETMAVEYLQRLSGGTATAYSAVAVGATHASGSQTRNYAFGVPSPVRAATVEGCLATETAEVRFKTLPPEIIQWYVSTGEPMGRAGAFGISRLGEVLTQSIDGCHSCVAGLPKTALLLALAHVVGATHASPVLESLRQAPAGLVGTRVRLRTLALGVGHEVDHRHDNQCEERRDEQAEDQRPGQAGEDRVQGDRPGRQHGSQGSQ
jgi:septum formation protein